MNYENNINYTCNPLHHGSLPFGNGGEIYNWKEMKKGDWVIIKGFHQINPDKFAQCWPMGIFGRIIDITAKYSSMNGRRLPDKFTIRGYPNNGVKKHYKTTKEHLTKISIK